MNKYCNFNSIVNSCLEERIVSWAKESFWGRPVFNPTQLGDERPDNIYLQVGRSLSAWEILEEEIGSLFTVVTHDGTTEGYVLKKHLFGNVESSSNRLSMLRTALVLYFGHYWNSPSVSIPFKEVIKVIGFASHRRNEIAHGRVTAVIMHRGEKPPLASGYFLTAPNYAINRSQPYYGGGWHANDVLVIDRSLYRYRASEISILESKFEFLSSKVRDLLFLAAKGEHKLPNIVINMAREGKLLKG